MRRIFREGKGSNNSLTYWHTINMFNQFEFRTTHEIEIIAVAEIRSQRGETNRQNYLRRRIQGRSEAGQLLTSLAPSKTWGRRPRRHCGNCAVRVRNSNWAFCYCVREARAIRRLYTAWQCAGESSLSCQCVSASRIHAIVDLFFCWAQCLDFVLIFPRYNISVLLTFGFKDFQWIVRNLADITI